MVTDPIFVFGSNLAGRHGKGAALWAVQHRGAVYGQGFGMQGNSYALPTKDGRNGADLKDPAQTLPLEAIRGHAMLFLAFACAHPHRTFQLTPIGCGHAGYTPEQIAPMFAGAPPNVILPPEFLAALNR